MTREEASEILSDKEITCLIGKFHGAKEALDLALTALRPVSREKVEKVWRGEWIRGEWIDGEKKSLPTAECSLCKEIFPEYYSVYKFCPACGAAQADEAVDMVMERMEALHDNRT